MKKQVSTCATDKQKLIATIIGSAEEEQERTAIFQHVIDCIIKLYQSSEDSPEIRALIHPHLDLVNIIFSNYYAASILL